MLRLQPEPEVDPELELEQKQENHTRPRRGAASLDTRVQLAAKDEEIEQLRQELEELRAQLARLEGVPPQRETDS